MTFLDMMGWLGVLLVSICNVPQVIKIRRTRKTNDYSLFGYVLLLLGCVFITIRAIIVVGDVIYVTSNILNTAVIILMVGMIVKYRKA